MKSKDLAIKTKEELMKLIDEKRKRIEDVRFKAVSGGIKNVKEMREDKKDIARIMTELNKKQHA
ncbi:MAG: 50S ribosomal protein L29 [Candidatus Pacebacteria bacterium]|nr:50S ribosomal protein L29 [Candidatus Paceibacterota bacterium]